ncbi:CsgG/HfaB family protein [Candidatus Aerophobetes bacterium]|nr:CsgG/HfaB family protein [Candidatus Aerophobetes bacterium]
MVKRKRHAISLWTILPCLVLLFLGTAATSMAQETEEPGRVLKKRIAVAGFENKVQPWWGWHWDIGEGMSDMLVSALVNTGRFTVLEREALQDILEEQNLAEEGRVSAQTAAQAGKLLGAQILIRGAITEFSHQKSGTGGQIKIKGFSIGGTKEVAHVAVDVRMYDTTSGEILTSKPVEGGAETRALKVGVVYKDLAFGAGGFEKTPLGKATREVINEAVELIISEMKAIPWEGAVVTVRDGQVYINAGSNDNVEQGDRFLVFEKGEELVDPMTGLSLGAEETELGIIKVVSIKEKYSIAETVLGSGFSRGNIIREGL